MNEAPLGPSDDELHQELLSLWSAPHATPQIEKRIQQIRKTLLERTKKNRAAASSLLGTDKANVISFEKRKQWIESAVLPVLERFRESMNIDELASVGYFCSEEEKSEWDSVLAIIRHEISDHTNKRTTKIFEMLTDKFFRSKEIVISFRFDPQRPGDNNELDGFSLVPSTVLQTKTFPFSDGALRVDWLEPLEQTVRVTSNFMHETGRVVLYPSQNIDPQIREISQLLTPQGRIMENWSGAHRPEVFQAKQELASYVQREYESSRIFKNMLERRILAEEVRHGMSGLRVAAAGGAALKSVYELSLLWSDVMLSKNKDAQVRNVVLGKYTADEETTQRTQIERALIADELLSQMTAAACTDPHFVLKEWELALLGAGGSKAHYGAALFGTNLLAQLLHLSPPANSKISPVLFAIKELHAVDKKTLRLALADIFARESITEIDEDPFPKINEQGELMGNGLL